MYNIGSFLVRGAGMDLTDLAQDALAIELCHLRANTSFKL